MKLSDKELNYILSECVKHVLLESTPEGMGLNNQGQKKQVLNTTINTANTENPYIGVNMDGDAEYGRDTWNYETDEEYSNTVTQKAKPKNVLKQAGKALAWTVGGAALSAIVGGALGGDVGAIVANLGMYAGIGVAMASIGKSSKHFLLLKNMKIPRDVSTAKKVAVLAAAERINTQKQCYILQKNLTAAIAEFNKVFAKEMRQRNQQPLTWELLQPLLLKTSSNFTLAKQIGGDNIDVNFKTNFQNKNVTEAKLLENDYATKEYDNFDFKEKNEMDALQEVIVMGELYCETYKLWYSWTRYIQVLIKYFPDDLKWNDIIQSVGKKHPDELFDSIYHLLFPTISKLTDTINDRNSRKDGKTRSDIEQEVSNMGKKVRLTVIDVNFKFDEKGDGNMLEYVIFQDDNGEKYALLKQYYTNAIANTTLYVKNLHNYITNNNIYDENGDIPKLKPYITKAFTTK